MNDITRISLPISVWLAAFSMVYGLEGLICSPRWVEAGLSAEAGRIALLTAWAAAIALHAGLLAAIRAPRFASPSPAIQWISVTLAVVALVSIVWTLVPVAVTSMCLPVPPP